MTRFRRGVGRDSRKRQIRAVVGSGWSRGRFMPSSPSATDVNSVKSVRDKLHQDRLGARENIDWHTFSYDNAFTPAARAMRSLLSTNAGDVPKETNLTAK